MYNDYMLSKIVQSALSFKGQSSHTVTEVSQKPLYFLLLMSPPLTTHLWKFTNIQFT